MSIVDFSIKPSKTLFKKTLENHTFTRQSKKIGRNFWFRPLLNQLIIKSFFFGIPQQGSMTSFRNPCLKGPLRILLKHLEVCTRNKDNKGDIVLFTHRMRAGDIPFSIDFLYTQLLVVVMPFVPCTLPACCRSS